ncbi:MAG: hypothetical protein R3B70_06280 [Polyangiaceae bacterium]
MSIRAFLLAVVVVAAGLAGQADWPVTLDLHECLEDCEYRHGGRIEACSRKRDPGERGRCYEEANARRARCRRDCEKKYPEG